MRLKLPAFTSTVPPSRHVSIQQNQILFLDVYNEFHTPLKVTWEKSEKKGSEARLFPIVE